MPPNHQPTKTEHQNPSNQETSIHKPPLPSHPSVTNQWRTSAEASPYLSHPPVPSSTSPNCSQIPNPLYPEPQPKRSPTTRLVTTPRSATPFLSSITDTVSLQHTELESLASSNPWRNLSIVGTTTTKRHLPLKCPKEHLSLSLCFIWNWI